MDFTNRNGVIKLRYCSRMPISPFLFCIAITYLLSDADKIIRNKYGDIRGAVSLTRSLLYADDTFIIESHAEIAQKFMDVIRQMGS